MHPSWGLFGHEVNSASCRTGFEWYWPCSSFLRDPLTIVGGLLLLGSLYGLGSMLHTFFGRSGTSRMCMVGDFKLCYAALLGKFPSVLNQKGRQIL